MIVPEVSSLNMELLTKEAYDMESYRYSSDRKGDDPGETFDIRDYRPGDSIKQIHWKLTGKLDHVVIKEMSYPVYDSVLILPELFCENGQPEKKDALAEIFASAAMSFLNRKIPFETGFYDGATDRFYMERIETEEDFWNVIYLFLRSAAYENSAKTIEEYLENYGERRFAHYIYITAQGKTQEEDELQAFGETTVLRCGDSFEVRENEIQCTPGSWKKELGAQDIWR